MKININELAEIIKKHYNLAYTPIIEKVEMRGAIGEFKTQELGIGSTLNIFISE